jgi:hypothetical protein
LLESLPERPQPGQGNCHLEEGDGGPAALIPHAARLSTGLILRDGCFADSSG